MSAAANSSQRVAVGKGDAAPAPTAVKPMPAASELGAGLLSLNAPTSGWSSDAVN